MATNTLESLTKEQHDQIERIKTYDAGCRGAFNQQMGYAFLAGMELNAVKDRLPHGQFLKWREAYLVQLPERSAQRYMKFAVTIAASKGLPRFEDVKLLPDGTIPEKEREQIIKAVHKIADGKTLTELYRDLGVIRDPEAKQHHPRKQLTPEEIVKAEIAQAEATLEAMLSQVRSIHDNILAEDSTLVSRIKPARWKEAVRILTACNKALRPLSKKGIGETAKRGTTRSNVNRKS